MLLYLYTFKSRLSCTCPMTHHSRYLWVCVEVCVFVL